jgi:plastocyanin
MHRHGPGQQGGFAVAQRRRRARFVVGLLGAVALVAAAGGVVLAADHAVAISGFAFSPATVSVTVGDTVTWTNSDAQGHTATADGGVFDTGTIGNTQSATVTFATAGSFPYHCSIHPDMTGTVVVAAASSGTGSGGSGGSGTATQPPTDAAPADAPVRAALAGLLALVLAAAGTAGFLVGRRRFSLR